MNLPTLTTITGMGAVSAGGKNIEELWQRVLQGNVRAEHYELRSRLAGNEAILLPVYRAELPQLSTKDQHLVKQADRTALLLLAAAREAWQSAQLTEVSYAKKRIGIVIGSSRGPMMLQEEHANSLKKRPSAALYTTCSSMANLLATAFSIEGPSLMVASNCTSGATALAMGEQLLQSGTLDLVLVGGVDAPLSDSLLAQYHAAGVLSTDQDPCMALRPFDRDRLGTVLGEGAAVVVLESEQRALQRRVPIIGRLNTIALQSAPGCRASLDPQGKALQQVMRQSLEQSKLTSDSIAVVHLHGTGTKKNDQIESCAIASVFGECSRQPVAWTNKPLTGHVLGAAPLFQLILALQTMQHHWVPPVMHCEHLDPACQIRLSRGERLVAAPALCINSGFWGNVSSIVISPYF